MPWWQSSVKRTTEAEETFYEAKAEMKSLTKELERAVERLESAIDRIEKNGRGG